MAHAERDATRMTAEAYLAWERDQREKHEYHHGEVFAMAGGSPRHNVLSASATAALHATLRGKGCHVLSSDQRVSVVEGERYVYPDVVVACGGVQTSSESLVNPSVVVEVLSRSTERYDRGGKWEAYQRIASLTDYVLVAQDRVRVEHFQRDAHAPGGAWTYRVHEPGGTLVLSNRAQIALDALYEGAFDVEGYAAE